MTDRPTRQVTQWRDLDAEALGQAAGQFHDALHALAYSCTCIFGVQLPIESTAAEWWKLICSDDPDQRRAYGREILDARLIEPDLVRRESFWASPLGRVLVCARALPEYIGESVAATILGVSRQRVAELRAAGRLSRPVGLKLYRGESLAEHLDRQAQPIA